MSVAKKRTHGDAACAVRDWVDFFEAQSRQNGEIAHPREYLLVLGTRI
jgi:hypothetical protein